MAESFASALTKGKRKTSSPLANNSKTPNLNSSTREPTTTPDDLTNVPENNDPDIQNQLEQLTSMAISSDTYIPSNGSNQQQTRTRPTYKAASEASFSGTWSRGNTDLVQIEILGLNGQSFAGSLDRKEAIHIWCSVLGLEKSLIVGVSFKKQIKRNLILNVKLNKRINIDSDIARPDFSYNRGAPKEDGSFDILNGRVLGVRRIGGPPQQDQRQNSPFTRVNIYGLHYEVSKEKLTEWLNKFGQLFGEFAEIMDRDDTSIGTGDLTCLMKITKPIPCFLPIAGKKIRVAYKDMQTICGNCFSIGHMVKDCKNRRRDWLDYVAFLRETGRFEDEMFGDWIKKLESREQYLERVERRKERENQEHRQENVRVDNNLENQDEEEISQIDGDSEAEVYNTMQSGNRDEDEQSSKQATNCEETRENEIDRRSTTSTNRSFLSSLKNTFFQT